MKAFKAFEQVKASAEEIRNDREQRFPDAASVGDYFRQGDLYITKLAEVPAGAVQVSFAAQLAEGNTQGSRHCLDDSHGVTLYRLREVDDLTGPVLKIQQERTVTHPEHGDVVLPSGVYSITYQRAFADELRRVAD